MNTVNEVPHFMAKGSVGSHVTILHAFLIGLGLGKEIQFDAEYGDVTAQAVKAYQSNNGLEEDGCFGPQTREWAKKENNFDFEAACLTVAGKTIFSDLEHDEESVIYENKIRAV